MVSGGNNTTVVQLRTLRTHAPYFVFIPMGNQCVITRGLQQNVLHVKCAHTVPPLTVFRDALLTIHDNSQNEINIMVLGEWGGHEISLPFSIQIV